MEKLKTQLPLITFIIVVAIIAVWAIFLQLKVNAIGNQTILLTNQTATNSKDIISIVDFINKNTRVGTTTQQ